MSELAHKSIGSLFRSEQKSPTESHGTLCNRTRDLKSCLESRL
jgi:hypothetical protein